MKNGITLNLPANMKYFKILKNTISHLGNIVGYDKQTLNSLIKASKELMKNIGKQAYSDQNGYIEISLYSFEHGIRIDMKDWGMPLSKKQFLDLLKKKNNKKSMAFINMLVDRFQYKNLGKNGKQFTLIKHVKHPIHLYRIEKHHTTEIKKKDLIITTRDFHNGDEDVIAKLIYKNYQLSYSKEDFYYPVKILEGQNKKFVSIVAEVGGRVVGHFALLLLPTSNIAEIGVVVVDPDYKGLGIMNKMFDHLLKKANKIKLSAVFGEAIMYHIFSQKSNLTHHFCESALVLGHTPADYKIEHNKLTERGRRGADLFGFRFFEQRKVLLYLPIQYKEQILLSYSNCCRPYEVVKQKKVKSNDYAHLSYQYNPISNLGTIIINHYGKDFKYKFILLLDQLRAKHCDMIYTDINLEQIPQINKVIKFLNNRGFFYSGMFFLGYNDQDHLRLQYKHSDNIGKRNMVCYSKYCKDLLAYIQQDEKRIKKSLK